MILSDCTYETVFHVARNMREIDRREIYSLRYEESPFVITNDVMARNQFAWVAWHDNLPAAVFGGQEIHPGVWRMFCFGTDAFPRIALGLTRFARSQVLPTLFNKLGAHRLEADSHEAHTEAHRWLRLLGAAPESTMVAYGKDRSNYFRYVLHAPVDS